MSRDLIASFLRHRYKWSMCYFIVLVIGLTNCETSSEDSQRDLDQQSTISLNTLSALPKTVKHPKENPSTVAKVELGRLLFYDPILSGNKDVSCASCHHPDFGYAEYLDLSIGVSGIGLSTKRKLTNPDIPRVKRNSQTVLNTAFNGITSLGMYEPEEAPMFWDIRSKGLEEQALEPVKSLEEMKGHGYHQKGILDEVVMRVNDIPAYVEQFDGVFGLEKGITADHIAKAIACFERSLITNNSRFDQYMRGDQDAISQMEKEGLALFREVGCVNCHNGPMLSDYKVHVLGVAEHPILGYADKGVDSTFAFRTPSLRNLRFTAPYMHNGSLPNLRRVLEFYQDLTFTKSRNNAVGAEDIDPLTVNMNLKVKDMSSIVSFLNTLNDDSFDKKIPEKVPSGLPVGGNIL